MNGSVALRLALAVSIASSCPANEEVPEFIDFTAPEHEYWDRPLQDPFTRFLAKQEREPVTLDHTSDRAFVASLLSALEISPSSQLLLFSKTSLQLGRISPENPRALYYNEDISIGYIPGGKIEVASVDPRVGAVFHIFDIPRGGERLEVTRSGRCMNCHVDQETHEVPGFVIKSVIPGPNGGSLDGFRTGETGHHVPLAERFGGYYLTGAPPKASFHANRVGRFVSGEIVTEEIPFGERFDLGRYLAPGSDLLSHLIHEHQAGFTNRVIAASYLARSLRARANGGELRPGAKAVLDRLANELVRYLLFSEEAPLPVGGIEGDAAFRAHFLSRKRSDSSGRSLRDLDLHDRLFKHRCSYMIYSPAFQALPEEVIRRVYERLRRALGPNGGNAYSYLPPEEKRAILAILEETLPGW